MSFELLQDMAGLSREDFSKRLGGLDERELGVVYTAMVDCLVGGVRDELEFAGLSLGAVGAVVRGQVGAVQETLMTGEGALNMAQSKSDTEVITAQLGRLRRRVAKREERKTEARRLLGL